MAQGGPQRCPKAQGRGFRVSRGEAAVRCLASGHGGGESALSSIRGRWCAQLGLGRGSRLVWVPVGRGRCGDTDGKGGVGRRSDGREAG